VRSSLARLLRYLATKIDGTESDAELRARVLGLFRRPSRGSPFDLETVIRNNLPMVLDPTFEWSQDRRTMTMRIL
jgi:hypothetical protein